MSPPRLTEASLHSARSGTILPTYDRGATRFGIVHIGPGAFHRAHQAYYVDTLLHCRQALGDLGAVAEEHGPARCARAAAGPVHAARTRRRAARARDRRDPRVAGRRDRCGARVRAAGRARHAHRLADGDRKRLLPRRAKRSSTWRTPDIAHDLAESQAAPRSTIGWIVEGLRRRRAQDVPPFAVLSCDNLPDNGAVLHRALVAFARASDAELARWIEAEVVCPRTMVDSITPATDDALRERAQKLTGVRRRVAHPA